MVLKNVACGADAPENGTDVAKTFTVDLFLFFRRERLKGGTPKRTKAAWPEKATSENATCDENMFLFFRENMNRIVPQNVEMVCERAT